MWSKIKQIFNTRIGWTISVVIFSFLFFIVASIVALLFTLPFAIPFNDDSLPEFLIGFTFPVVLVAGSVLTAFILRNKLNMTIFETLGWKMPNKKTWWVLPAALGSYVVLTIIGSIILFLINPEVAQQKQDVATTIESYAGIKLLFFGIFTALLVPIAEETFFRGLLYNVLGFKLKKLLAVVLVAVLFGIAHFQLNISVDTFLFGLATGVLTWQVGSIYPAISLHILKNAIAFAIIANS